MIGDQQVLLKYNFKIACAEYIYFTALHLILEILLIRITNVFMFTLNVLKA